MLVNKNAFLCYMVINDCLSTGSKPLIPGILKPADLTWGDLFAVLIRNNL